MKQNPMIVLHPSEDRFHNLREQGSYEWTYFDGLSEDGKHGFTAIWFRGLPMSPYYTAAIDGARSSALPQNYCGFAFGLYCDGKRIASGLEEGVEEHFFGDEGSPDASFKENSLFSAVHKGGVSGHRIKVDIRRPLWAGRIFGEIELEFPKHDAINGVLPYNPNASKHFWVPAAPNGSFSAAIDLVQTGKANRKYRFKGRAYHDRNFGTEPLHHLDVHWHWGRFHFDSKAFVFFDIRARQNAKNADFSPFRKLLLYDGGQLVECVEECDFAASGWRNHWAALPYPATFASIAEGEMFGFNAKNIGLLDSGPFYHRMAAQFDVCSQNENGTGLGMTEYMRPSRLGVGIFRPFVKFRARRIS